MSDEGCEIEEKVQYAESANFSAIIMYNPTNDSDLDSKNANLSLPFLNLTTVAVSFMAGIRIKEKYLYTNDSKSRVIIMKHSSAVYNYYLKIFAVIFILTSPFLIRMCCHIVIMLIELCQHCRNRPLVVGNRGSNHDLLDQLETTKYKQGFRNETCAICLEDYKENEDLRILPCLHEYHCKCIDPWLKNNQRNCPICNQKVSLLVRVLSYARSHNEEERSPLMWAANAAKSNHGTFNSGFDDTCDSNLSQGNNQSCRNVPSNFAGDKSEEKVTPSTRPSSSKEKEGASSSNIDVSPSRDASALCSGQIK